MVIWGSAHTNKTVFIIDKYQSKPPFQSNLIICSPWFNFCYDLKNSNQFHFRFVLSQVIVMIQRQREIKIKLNRNFQPNKKFKPQYMLEKSRSK